MALTTIQARSSDYDERFGFETSGTFYCPYSAEKFYIVLIIFIAISGCVGIDLGLIASFPPDSEVAFFMALALLAGWGVWLFLCYIAFRLVLKGSQYHYKADESKLTITHGPQTQDFFYMNIMNVRYDPIMLLRKQRGFLVTVVTRKGTHTFKYIYNNPHANITPQNTPFYILEERSGLRKEIDPDLYFKYKREHQLEEEVVIESGELERPVKYDERLHPANVEVKPMEEEDFIIAKGSFYSPNKLDRALLILFAALGIVGIGAAIIVTAQGVRHLDFKGVYAIFAVLVAIIIMVGIYRIACYGDNTYTASGKQFHIKDYKGNVEIMYYNDVEEVRYSALKRFGMQRGYKVDIVTKYRTITYNYMFPKNKKYQGTSDTPFHIIEEHITK